ncbi:ParB/RepB/Spo0J family partition protein [Duganella sp. HH105]|uniref:ParB/RepB/Spo0J family partition protein n=1 Tax=Duganella sp. HH105 TaxID=1781067 RepID=UPI000892B10B|nr:ParB/RepB/Spo0J family partition protein [Duganella sp. HH105]OEZ54875.1 transcriptional repressor protein KorB [Duganella sp. HH105]
MALDLSMLDVAPSAATWRTPTAPLEAFDEDPCNLRFEEEEAGEFEALVAELRARGMLQPLVVRRMPSGRLLIRFGFRRFRAARCAGLAAVPYVVTEDERQFDDYAQVAENARRRDLQPLELATFIARKLAQGERKKEVAARLRLDASAVTHLLALVDDPPPMLLELYHSRRCRSPQYLYELRKLYGRQPQLVRRALADGGEVDRLALATLAAGVQAAVDDGGDLAPAAANGSAAPAASLTAAAGPASGEAPIRRPGLFAVHDGREVLLVLQRRPSAVGRIWVRCDGEDMELSFDELRLCRLEDLAGSRLRGERMANVRPAVLSVEEARTC